MGMPFSLFFGLSSSTHAFVGLDVDQLMTPEGLTHDRYQVANKSKANGSETPINAAECSVEILFLSAVIQVLFDPDQLFNLKGAAKP
jgi:hypothetical protein